MFKKLILLLTFGILLSAVWTSVAVYAQNNNTTTNTAVPPKTHAVKITSPIKGQQLHIGDNLIVSGTSSDNATSDCHVSVIVNSIKPYQPALASGPGGANDYSKWSFTLSPKYTAIKEGENKITAKYSCSNDPSLVSFSSINVTGMLAGAAGATKQQQSVMTTGNNAAKENNITVAAATPSTQFESSYIESGKAPGHRSTSNTTSTCIGTGSISSSSGDSSGCNCSNGSSCTSGKAPGHRSSREPTTQGSSPSQFNPFIFPFGPP
jgi:hypothetical protein